MSGTTATHTLNEQISRDVFREMRKAVDKYRLVEASGHKAKKTRPGLLRITYYPSDFRELRSQMILNTALLNAFLCGLSGQNSSADSDAGTGED